MNLPQVLIVDDEPPICRSHERIVGRHLGRGKVDIKCFPNAHQAIKHIKSTARWQIICVLTDLNLSQGSGSGSGSYEDEDKNNGVEVVRASMECDIPVIVCSGEDYDEPGGLRERLTKLNDTVIVLKKPIDTDALRKFVDESKRKLT